MRVLSGLVSNRECIISFKCDLDRKYSLSTDPAQMQQYDMFEKS